MYYTRHILAFFQILGILLIGNSLHGQTSGRPTDLAGKIEQSRSLVKRELNKKVYPGVAVAVWQDGEMIWSEGFGYANIEDSIPPDPARSLYRVGSISKALAAAGLAILVEKDDFDLDAPIQKYVPYFPEKKWPITTRQVAQHIAGIRHYWGMEFMSNAHYHSVEEAIGIFMNDTLLFEPGSKYSYSSYGWNLVSAAMEGAAHKPFLKFMQKEVFHPLGMKSTYPDDIHMDKLPRVTFYDFVDSSLRVAFPVDLSNKWAGGGFISTAEDLVKFGVGMMNNTLVSAGTSEEFWTPGTLNDGSKTTYGLGWATNEDKRGYHWVGHAGGSVGGSSMLLIYPDKDFVVVTLVNRSNSNAAEIAFMIAEQFLPPSE